MVAFEAVALARAAMLLALLGWARLASGAPLDAPLLEAAPSAAAATAAVPARTRQLLTSPASVGTIYNSGLLEWRSWSWGLSGLDVHSTDNPMPGATRLDDSCCEPAKTGRRDPAAMATRCLPTRAPRLPPAHHLAQAPAPASA